MKARLAATVAGIAAFEQALDGRGLLVDAAEDFEDARPARGFLGLRTGAPTGPIDDPLDTNTENEFFRAGQIPAALSFQSNTDNTGVTGPSPVGERASRSAARRARASTDRRPRSPRRSPRTAR